MPDPATHVLIMFDGLCEPNPGGVACFGFSIRGLGADCEGVVVGSGVLAAPEKGPPLTNNYAEYTALGRALAYLVANARARITAETRLSICGDSKLVVEQVKGNWKCEAPALVPLRDACLEKLKLLGCKWSIEWIPRGQNVEADALSRAAYVGRTGKPVPERHKGEGEKA